MCKIKRTDFGLNWGNLVAKLNYTYCGTNTNSNSFSCIKSNTDAILQSTCKMRTVDVDNAEKTLLQFVDVDRNIRNYSNETDYDKFCESTNIAIETYIEYTHGLEEIIKSMQGGDNCG